MRLTRRCATSLCSMFAIGVMCIDGLVRRRVEGDIYGEPSGTTSCRPACLGGADMGFGLTNRRGSVTAEQHSLIHIICCRSNPGTWQVS